MPSLPSVAQLVLVRTRVVVKSEGVCVHGSMLQHGFCEALALREPAASPDATSTTVAATADVATAATAATAATTAIATRCHHAAGVLQQTRRRGFDRRRRSA